MHEFSTSSEIVRTVLDSTEKNNGKRVLSIQLEIGELTLLNVEQVTFWIHELFKGSLAEDAKVKVKTVKARIKCRKCGYEGGMKSWEEDPLKQSTFFSCPKCRSSQLSIVKGRECILRKIQAIR